jgi:tRNA-dihydrouridine synthase A
MDWFRVSVAPMVDRTDRYLRYLIRLLAPKMLLYTEMHTTGAIIHGDAQHILGFDPEEKPLSLQIAGDNADQIALAMEAAQKFDYDEFNLNVGCPSDKVQEANYGACLMAEPDKVAGLVKRMKAETNRPVTVKQRIGIRGKAVHSRESYEEMREFSLKMIEAGAERIIIHARIAILDGLSPKENRQIPPLRYEDVYRFKEEIGDSCKIEINGHIKTPAEAREHLEHCDGVMIGRAAYEDSWVLSHMDRLFLDNSSPMPSRESVIRQMMPYIDRFQDEGIPPHRIFKHLTGLVTGMPGARKFRQILSPPLPKTYRGSELLQQALEALPEFTRTTSKLGKSSEEGEIPF